MPLSAILAAVELMVGWDAVTLEVFSLEVILPHCLVNLELRSVVTKLHAFIALNGNL